MNHCIENSYPHNSYEYIVDMAEKGFNLIGYAYMPLIDEDENTSNHYYMKEIKKNKFMFLGFLILKQIRY